MYLDVVDLRAFYAERLGTIVRRLIGLRLKQLWPSVAGERLLGIGYATPYLSQFSDDADRKLAFMPARQGVVNWPSRGPNAAALVHEGELPLAAASIDRVVAVHSLEVADSAHDLLREIWRVLAPGGRLIVVAPNRAGVWAQMETTPFGYGRPYSRGQLTQLLRETMFSPAGWSEALAMPPVSRRLLLRTGTAWERVGARFWPRFSGVLIVDATKQLYQTVPVRQRARAEPAWRPALAPAAGRVSD